MSKKKSQLWKFNFLIEREDGKDIDVELPNNLLEKILKWVEDNGCQMGGGYYPTDDNADDIKKFKFPYREK